MLQTDYEEFLKIVKKNWIKFIDNKLIDTLTYFDYSRIRDRNSTFIQEQHSFKENFHQ